MKTCPACHGNYEDAQNFCLNDGSTLVSASPGAPASSFPTENISYDRSAARTDVMMATPTAGASYPPPMPAQPSPYMMPPQVKRSPLPWILVGAVVLIAAVVGIVLATRSSGTSTSTGGSTTTSTGSSSGSSSGTSTGTTTGTTSTASGLVYNSPDGRFSITLPPGFSEFKSQTTKQPTLAGDIELTILQTENTRGGCMVGFSDFPEASFQGRTPQKMLEDGRDGALRNIGGTLEKQENITVQGKTGISIYGSGTSGSRTYYVRFNFILDKPRAYQVGFLAYDRAELDKPDINEYLKSFTLK